MASRSKNGNAAPENISMFINECRLRQECCGCNNPQHQPVENVGCQFCGLEFTLCPDCVNEDECPFENIHIEEIIHARLEAKKERVRDPLAKLRLNDLEEWDE